MFKKAKKEDLGNYRPVSLTSIPGKILEKLIKESMCNTLVEGKILNDSQHGFVVGRSCITNLISFYDRVSHHLDMGDEV